MDLAGEALERFWEPSANGYERVERLDAGAELAPESLGEPAVSLAELFAFALGR